MGFAKRRLTFNLASGNSHPSQLNFVRDNHLMSIESTTTNHTHLEPSQQSHTDSEMVAATCLVR